MTDKLGTPLLVGDQVIYTTGAQSETYLGLGTILSIDSDIRAKIRTESGRTTTNYRRASELLSIEPIKQHSPHLFI